MDMDKDLERIPFRGTFPKVHPSAFIAPGVVLIGDVEIGPDCSLWPGCVLRGDVQAIRIGARTNLQDGTVVHVTAGGQGVHVGQEVTVGHMALLHDCTLETGSFIGMRATVMDGAKVSSGGVLGAGALLTPGKCVPSGQLWTGAPAKFRRTLTPEDLAEFGPRWREYVDLSKQYA